MGTKNFLISLIVLAVLSLALYVVGTRMPAEAPVTENSYTNTTYGFSFSYPEGYLLDEKEVGNAERSHYNISLFEDTQFVRDLLAGKVIGTEAPPSISIDVYQNLEGMTAEAWVRGNANSNFKLSLDGTLASTTVDGVPAVSYSWDGLYRGDSIVAAHKNSIIMLSVGYHSPEDKIRDDFSTVIDSLDLAE